mmetsp:Transcript_16466/g.35666  ORF Transcript_16466/g.35666 Transcript_16466/m.35666 type:complete len:186 (-) Transcript_16466:118-675(-)
MADSGSGGSISFSAAFGGVSEEGFAEVAGESESSFVDEEIVAPPLAPAAPPMVYKADKVRQSSAAYTSRPGEGMNLQAWFLEGVSKEADAQGITPAQVALHNTAEDCWIILRNKVYDISKFLKFHPGGSRILVDVAGTDCTELFDSNHQWINEEILVGKCFVGDLKLSMALRDLSHDCMPIGEED